MNPESSKASFEERMQRFAEVVSERGYFVVAGLYSRLKPGDTVQGLEVCDKAMGDNEVRAVVLSETDYADFAEQMRLCGETPEPQVKGCRYFRCSAD